MAAFYTALGVFVASSVAIAVASAAAASIPVEAVIVSGAPLCSVTMADKVQSLSSALASGRASVK